MGTRALFNPFWKRFGRDGRGQDIIEYALVAGLVSLSAGATMPSVAGGLTTTLSKVGVVLVSATADAGATPPAVTTPPPASAPPPITPTSTSSGSGSTTTSGSNSGSGSGRNHFSDGHGRD